MPSEIAKRADFSHVRYAQCWEDADVLLEALAIRPGDRCVAIASAGDNVMSMLSRAPGYLVALDLSQAQITCLELRIAAYRTLDHGGLLELIGSRPSRRREELYGRCRSSLSSQARWFWDSRGEDIASGIGAAGKFERYLALFRSRVLPLIHPKWRVERLFQETSLEERTRFYEYEWNSARWRIIFRAFCSRLVLGRLGRDPEFFRYANGSVGTHLLDRARHMITVLVRLARQLLQARSVDPCLEEGGPVRGNDVGKVRGVDLPAQIEKAPGRRRGFDAAPLENPSIGEIETIRGVGQRRRGAGRHDGKTGKRHPL